MSDLTEVSRKLVAVFAADVEGYNPLLVGLSNDQDRMFGMFGVVNKRECMKAGSMGRFCVKQCSKQGHR